MHGMMSFTDFQKALFNVCSIGTPKKIIFAGLGEPLINKSIVDMVSFASKKTSTVLLTNASLLNEAVSTKLISAGLNELRISLQGLSSAQYKKVCGVSIDFERLKHQIKYLYERKNQCKVSVKIIDKFLEDEESTNEYFRIFNPIADNVTVESLIPTNNLVFDGDEGYAKTLKGGEAEERIVCPLPFYQIVVNYNGDIHAGCSDKNGTFGCPVIGNALQDEMALIWNNGTHYDVCMKLLDGKRKSLTECRFCYDYKYQGSNKDNLDKSVKEIIGRMKENQINEHI
jgi:MoaA/NifB/PqqE/SkfB family radical SAM enzyme